MLRPTAYKTMTPEQLRVKDRAQSALVDKDISDEEADRIISEYNDLPGVVKLLTRTEYIKNLQIRKTMV